MHKAEGTPSPTRPREYQTVPIIKSNNKPFKTRVRNGDIVVSDYQIGSLVWTFENGGPINEIGTPFTRVSTVESLHSVHGIGSIETIDNRACLMIGNAAIYANGTISYKCQLLRTTDGQPPVFEVPPVSWLTSQLTTNTGLVTSVLGDANRKSVDVLTSLAEMPESVRSALNGCLNILKMYREARRGEVRLFNKSKKLRREYDEALNSLSKLERNELISKREALLRKKQLKNDFKLNAKELADAISDVWLNFRYNIMPNVFLIQGVIKAAESKKNLFFEFTSTEREALDLLEGFTGSGNCLHKAFIKRKFDTATVYNSLSVNPFLTAWELIPLSFVVDWVINIGDLLSTLSVPSPKVIEGSTYSWKVTGYMSKTFDDGSRVTCNIQMYKRNVITPQSLCGLHFAPNITSDRRLDALALIWKSALKKHF